MGAVGRLTNSSSDAGPARTCLGWWYYHRLRGPAAWAASRVV